MNPPLPTCQRPLSCFRWRPTAPITRFSAFGFSTFSFTGTLADLISSRSINGDLDETRRLYKYLRSTHLGLQSADLFVHWAHFEQQQGYPDKSASVLRCASEYASIRRDPRIEHSLALLAADQPIPPLLLLPAKQPSPEPPPAETAFTPSAAQSKTRRVGLLGPPKRVTIEEEGGQTLRSQGQQCDATPRATTLTSHQLMVTPAATEPHDMSFTSGGIAARASRDEADEQLLSTRSRSVKINGKQYKVLQMIGRGGSSRVFRVMDGEGEMYALKRVSLRNLDATTLAGYTSEIDLLRAFAAEPSIIRLVDSELNAGRAYLYMIMEYGEVDLGRLLKERAAAGSTRDANFARYIWQQMLVAAQTVHRAKIVHCDLKPANFLLVRGRLKLIDFGISKAIQNDTTNIVRENQVGTVNYMSPEALKESAAVSAKSQARIKIGRASDVWSLGCILYEMTFGAPPFAQFSLIQRLQYITDEKHTIEYPVLDPPVNADLLDAIQGCLVRDVRQRYSIDQLLLHPFLQPSTAAASRSSSSAVVVRKRQIDELLCRFAALHPGIDTAYWTERIFEQWRGEEAGNE